MKIRIFNTLVFVAAVFVSSSVTAQPQGAGFTTVNPPPSQIFTKIRGGTGIVATPSGALTAPFPQRGTVPTGPIVYSELNYIDPVGNGCVNNNCTNGTAGTFFFKTWTGQGYSTPGTIWTQSQNGKLHSLRVMVFGINGLTSPIIPKTSWSGSNGFDGYEYYVTLWKGFGDYASDPNWSQKAWVSPRVYPSNANFNTPVAVAAGGGTPVFEWVFDVSEYNVPLEEGQEYVIGLGAVGSSALYGLVMRATSTFAAGPDVMVHDLKPAGYLGVTPYQTANPRWGTEVKVVVD